MPKSIQNKKGRQRAPGTSCSLASVWSGTSVSSSLNRGAWRRSPWSPAAQTPCVQPERHSLAGRRGCPELLSQAANEHILSCAHIWKQFLDYPRHLCCWAQPNRGAPWWKVEKDKKLHRFLTTVHVHIWNHPGRLLAMLSQGCAAGWGVFQR